MRPLWTTGAARQVAAASGRGSPRALLALLLASHALWALCLLSLWNQGGGSHSKASSKVVACAQGAQGSGLPWAGMMPREHPSKETCDRVQADPGLLQRSPELLTEFEAAPWLLPARTPALPYTGVHRLDALLRLRAGPAGKWSKAVCVLLFTRDWAAMMQNSVYSLVKFGGVRNYLVGTHTPEDLEACADLNLPCADVAAFLPQPLDHVMNGSSRSEHDQLVIKWLRPALAAHLLHKGYVTFFSDADVVYTAKPVWASYMQALEHGLDGALFLQRGGNTLLLPTPAARRFAQHWASLAADGIAEGLGDQKVLWRWHYKTYLACMGQDLVCFGERDEQLAKMNRSRDEVPLLLFNLPPHYMVTDDACFMAHPDPPLLDLCDWPLLFVHPQCTDMAGKVAGLKVQGLWFLDDKSCVPQASNARSRVTGCQPLHWRLPATELPLYSCPEFHLGLTHTPRQLQPGSHASSDATDATAGQRRRAARQKQPAL